jgi:transposase
VRQAQSASVMDALKRFLEHELARVSGKAEIAGVIRYALGHWDGLTRFLDDGRIELDTNIVERSMGPRRSPARTLSSLVMTTAPNWAVIASLIETANAQRYRSSSLARRCAHESRQSLTQRPPR